MVVLAICPSVKESVDYVKFKSIAKKLMKPFSIYADFEAILQDFIDQRDVASDRYQKHVTCGYAFKRVST